MTSEIITLIRARYSCIYCVTHEENRAAQAVAVAAAQQGYNLFSWSITTGIKAGSEGEGVKDISNTNDPLVALDHIYECEPRIDPDSEVEEAVQCGVHIPNKSIILLLDFHLHMGRDPLIMRRLKDCIVIGRYTARHIVIVGCRLELQPELEKEITVIDFSLPTREDLLAQATKIAEDNSLTLNGETDAILNAGSGLTTNEFADAAAKAIVLSKRLDPMVISGVKKETIRKSGILEIIETDVTFDDIGGLEELKAWVGRRKAAFGKAAREYGLPVPKGVCLCGVQGGGKSFATKAIASALGCPLVRLDAGRLFGGIVGSSEANTRSVIAQIEAFGQSVLWIDEIDKGFAGMTGGHDGDSGTTRRVIGTFLTWMQDKKAPVFIVATANDITKLPPELLRKGRWDELFFIDLPTREERVAIWDVQIRRHGRKSEAFNLHRLTDATDGWTGAEIQALFEEGMYSAFSVGGEPTTDTLIAASKETFPLSKTMGPQLQSLRDWFKGKGRAASRQLTMEVKATRKVG